MHPNACRRVHSAAYIQRMSLECLGSRAVHMPGTSAARKEQIDFKNRRDVAYYMPQTAITFMSTPSSCNTHMMCVASHYSGSPHSDVQCQLFIIEMFVLDWNPVAHQAAREHVSRSSTEKASETLQKIRRSLAVHSNSTTPRKVQTSSHHLLCYTAKLEVRACCQHADVAADSSLSHSETQVRRTAYLMPVLFG